MSESDRLALLVLGQPRYISKDLDALRESGYEVKIVPVTTRPDTLLRLKGLLSTHPSGYNALALLHDCFAEMFPFDQVFFAPFLPGLRFVTGVGAGYDHSKPFKVI